MVQYKDLLWQNQYFDTLTAGRFAIQRTESLLAKDNDVGSISGVYQDLHDSRTYGYEQVTTSGLNASGQYEFYTYASGYVVSQKRRHIDGPRVEKLMWWLDNIAIAHKMYNSNYTPSGVTISSGGFGWQIFNGVEYVDFEPMNGGSGLVGYCWADKTIWKQIRGAISHVCSNVCIVPPHDIGDYLDESIFFKKDNGVHNYYSATSGVWDSRWFYPDNHPAHGKIDYYLSSDVSGISFGNTPYFIPSGWYNVSSTLSTWLPPTNDEDWSKSIPSGNHNAEDYTDDFSFNNYGEIGQYGKLYSEEYDQYFPSSSGSVLLAGLQWTTVRKFGSYLSGEYKQYADRKSVV